MPDHLHRLPDGRALGWAEFGAADGQPLLFCHGFPSSRLGAGYLEASARRLGFRVISADRPGLGRSDFQSGRRVADWAADVASLADALELDRVAVLGVSAGGPYALACAALLPARVEIAAIASGAAPPEAPVGGTNPVLRLLSGAGKLVPGLQRLAVATALRQFRRDPERALARVTEMLPPPDRAVYADETLHRFFLADLEEALRQGVEGATWDAMAGERPWGFRLEAIAVPVRLWQGELDRNVPAAAGRYLEERIPGCRATFLPADGHVSTIVRHHQAMLRALAR